MSSGRRRPPQHAGNNAGDVEPFYTNEDVALLHDIVVLAQELLPNLPDRERLPTNALFSAYYDILPRIGINADHDSRYARVLFKIGGLRGEGSLYEKFEEILSRMGIEIEFDEGEHDSESDNGNAQTDLEDTEAAPILQHKDPPPRGRARRNSDSAWDLGIETPAKPAPRRNSYSSLNKSKPVRVLDRKSFLQEALRQQPSNDPPKEIQNQPGGNVGAWLNAKPEPSRTQRGRSISTQDGMRIRRRSISVATGRLPPTTTTSNHTSDEYHAESEITAFTSAHELAMLESVDFPHYRVLSKPSSSLMQVKAEVILQHHLSYLARRQLRVWRDRALQLQQDVANLELLARHHDRKALLNQALETWHSRYHEKRSSAETERFFAHLERRSVLARDFYLLHKAFTHWHVCAYEEAMRTQAARRHILRTRVFNAWRDITAVNELKVRRQVLKKFFGVWQRQHAAISATTAVQKYEGDLMEKVFKRWVQRVWALKANSWWAEGVKQRTFSLWNLTARKALEINRTAEDEGRLQLMWNAWRVWRAKMDVHIRQEDQAITFRHACLCYSVLGKWRGETKVIPAKKVLQTDVATRLLRETLALWLHRTRQERQAAAVDRLRILREAWTNWRHRSRLQVMRVRVDRRVVSEAIYRWILAGMAAMTRRQHNQNFLSNTLHHWARGAQEAKYRRWEEEDLAQQFAMQRTQEIMVERWSARTRFQHQLDANAVHFYTSRLLQGVISKWSKKAQHLQQLQQWSRDADFYFLTSKALKHWKASTEASKRDKRKAAYTQVRRMAKMNVARAILLTWHFKAKRVLDMHAQANQASQNKDIILGMNFFDRWRARTEELAEMEMLWRERFLRKHFEVWRDRSVAFQDLKVEAIISSQERRQTRAMKKWKLVVLQLRGRSIQAAEVQEKNGKRKFRKIFNYWQHKAAERRPIKRVEFSEGGGSNQMGVTARAEAWSDFGDEAEGDEWAKGLDEPIASTPIPGYLATPSRRTERVAAAAARFLSTTPRAPLSTPFERHLRAQYSGGLLPSLRKGPGRSTLGIGGGFPDITDKSTK